MEDVFARFVRSESVTLKHAKGMRNIWGKEFHTYHEIFLFLAGNAEFISDKMRLGLKPGMLVLIPKERFHQFILRGDETEYERLVLNFSQTPERAELIDSVMMDVRVIELPDTALGCLLDMLAGAVTRQLTQNERRLLLRAAFDCLLFELAHRQNDNAVQNAGSAHRVTKQAVIYIDENYASRLSVTSIASALNVSPSELTHVFKRDLRIPVYRYVTQKRLVCAKRLIEQGEGLSNAAYRCGFSDYSSFYRAYKKMFREPPSR